MLYDCDNSKCSDIEGISGEKITFYNPQNWHDEMSSFENNENKITFNGKHCNYCENKDTHLNKLLDNRKCLNDINKAEVIIHNNEVENLDECIKWASDRDDHTYNYVLYNDATNKIKNLEIYSEIAYKDGETRILNLDSFKKLIENRDVKDYIDYKDDELVSFFKYKYQCFNNNDKQDKSKTDTKLKLSEIEENMNIVCKQDSNKCSVAKIKDCDILDTNYQLCKYNVYKNFHQRKRK